MINTRDYFGRPLYLAGTPQPYQGFAPIGEFKPRQPKSAAGQLRDLLDAPSYTPTGSGNGQGTGTGGGTGSGTGTGTNTGTGGGIGGNAPEGQNPAGGNSAFDFALGAWNLGGAPQQGDQPIGYPDWQSVAKAIEWEQEHKGEYGGTGSISEDNPYKPDFTKYPGTPGSTVPPNGGGSSGSSGGGGSTGNTTSPQFGIGGAIGGYPGVYTPTPTAPPAGIGDWLGLYGGIDTLLGSGAATAGNLVAGPGQAPPVGGEFGAGLSNAIGQAGYANTILNGDASTNDKIVAGLGMINPILAAPFAINSALKAILGGADSADRRAIGEKEWEAVNQEFLRRLGRTDSLSPEWNHANIFADNTPDLNFLNSFLDSKNLRWGTDTQGDLGVGAFPGYLNGGSVEAAYGNNIDQLWADLANYYTSYDSAPQMGVVPTWGDLRNNAYDQYFQDIGGIRNAFDTQANGEPGSPTAAMSDFLNSFGGDPAQNPDYNWLVTPSSAYLYGVPGYGIGEQTGEWGWSLNDPAPKTDAEKAQAQRDFALKYYGDWGIPMTNTQPIYPWANNQVAKP